MSHRRIGVLVPAGNTLHAREFVALEAMAPPASPIEFVFRDFSYPAPGVGDFCSALAMQFAPPLAQLRAAGVSAVLIGCTAASMRCASPAYDAALAELAGAPVITAAGATRWALHALGLQRIVVATPYGAASNTIVRDYLESLGVTVAAIEGFGYDASPEIWAREVPQVDGPRGVEFALQIESRAAAPAVQGVYFPCTGMASVEAIGAYETRTGRVAIGSVLAGYWATLGLLGLLAPAPAGPKLLAAPFRR